jgi:hypothetical protein
MAIPFLCHASELRLAPGLCLYQPCQIHETLGPLIGPVVEALLVLHEPLHMPLDGHRCAQLVPVRAPDHTPLDARRAPLMYSAAARR